MGPLSLSPSFLFALFTCFLPFASLPRKTRPLASFSLSNLSQNGEQEQEEEKEEDEEEADEDQGEPISSIFSFSAHNLSLDVSSEKTNVYVPILLLARRESRQKCVAMMQPFRHLLNTCVPPLQLLHCDPSHLMTRDL